MEGADLKKTDVGAAGVEQEFNAASDSVSVDITEEKGTSQPSHAERKRARFQNDRTGRGNKRRNLGRGEWQRTNVDRRQQNDESRAKREAAVESGERKAWALPEGFAQEEIDKEDRKPKRKVAIMIGYSGTGYKGMQISPTEKTIEGDLFMAFVKAGAISKANADDPRKSALVRCARTDKGVHAAGNMISLKLIVEDPDIVQKINDNLAPQIRVWGLERTIGSFSCYQSCDSRWYEYLIPSHAFLPPHPSCFLAKQLKQSAEDMGDMEGWTSRQEEVAGFWEEVDDKEIQPILASLDEELRQLVTEALYKTLEDQPEEKSTGKNTLVDQAANIDDSARLAASRGPGHPTGTTETAAIVVEEPVLHADESTKEGIQPRTDTVDIGNSGPDTTTTLPPAVTDGDNTLDGQTSDMDIENRDALNAAIKQIKTAYEAAKRRYRIPSKRLQRIQDALDAYKGTRNFHNYTISKSYNEASAKRVIRSFVANPEPIIINGTEWLSLKVHGQSFMMHQIRKMVGMVALIVRCGSPISRIDESYRNEKWSIPKVPGLGLLLERPVFDSYNDLQATQYGREKLDFGKYEKEMEAFKQREIYQRIFEDEARENTFHQFFNHIDNFAQPHFLYLTSKGYEATKVDMAGKVAEGNKFEEEESNDDGDEKGGEGKAKAGRTTQKSVLFTTLA